MKALKIWFIGLPGSGKTTIAKEVAKKYGLCMVKTGDILREMAGGSDEVAAHLQKVMEGGVYADDQIVGEIVRERIAREDCKIGFVMDGYPRRVSQLGIFDPGFDLVFYLGISEREAKRRLLARGRKDDSESIINNRLRTHEKYIGDLLKRFEGSGKLFRINGEMSVEEVLSDVYAHIDKALSDEA